MLDELRNAWRDAVRNFRRELHAHDDDGLGQPTSRNPRDVRATILAAARELRRLEDELARTRRLLEEERNETESCRRRESLARAIGDHETAELGARFAARHAEKAALLERKAEILEAELEMRERELEEMKAALAAREQAAGEGKWTAASAYASLEDELRGDTEFRDLERRQREREAAARVEELKRRQGSG